MRKMLILVLLAPIAFLPWLATSTGSTPPFSATEAPVGAFEAVSFRMVETPATGTELTLGVLADDTILVGGWQNLARSRDAGLTWEKLPWRNGVRASVAADRVLYVDSATDRVFVSDTYLGCTLLAWSDDAGESFVLNPAACVPGIADHQKIATGRPVGSTSPTVRVYASALYLCANSDIVYTACSVSHDGGLTFTPLPPHGVQCGMQSPPVVDAAGVLYEASTECGAQLRRSPDGGVSWTAHDIPFPASLDFADVGVTSDGTVYVAYTDESYRPMLARSGDGGATWDGPFDVGGEVAHAALPALVAGADGRVAVAFYGTTDTRDGWDGTPSEAPADVTWRGYVAVVTSAADASPTVALARAAEHPLQVGCLTKKVTESCSQRNIFDYIDADVLSDGRVVAVWTDGCPPGCDEKAGSTGQVAVVAVQTGGPRLR